MSPDLLPLLSALTKLAAWSALCLIGLGMIIAGVAVFAFLRDLQADRRDRERRERYRIERPEPTGYAGRKGWDQVE